MRQQRVALYYKCKTPSGWMRFPAALNKLKKVRPRYAQVGDQQILYPEGHYELRHYVNRKGVWKNVGEDATEAQRLQEQAANTLTATKAAEDAGIAVVSESSRVHLAKKSKEFIERQRTRNKVRHAKILETTLPDFIACVGVNYADQLTESVILKWYTSLRERGNSSKTIENKHVDVFTFLKWAGVNTKALAPHGKPTSTKKSVKVYTLEELDTLFAAMKKQYHKVIFELLQKTGLREREAMFLEWSDISFESGTLTLHVKPEYGFDIKDRAERTVPIPAELAETLLAWRKKNPKGRFVIGNSKGKPNGEMLVMLKRIARNAGLNCGVCQTCIEGADTSQQECQRWTLKKFRSTYVTTMLRNGIDPRTLMSWTGHEDLETIMLYMAQAQPEEVAHKVNRIVWTKREKAA